MDAGKAKACGFKPQGINYIPFNEHVKETLTKLVELLNTAGFNLDTVNY